MKQYVVVDRIEEGICELIFDDGHQITVAKAALPKGTREGSVLSVAYELDEEERKRRIGDISEIQQRLLKRTKEGK